MATVLVSEPRKRTGRPVDPRRRARIEAFLLEARPWALKQARRRFPHIPNDLYEDVYQQACIEMLQRGPDSTDTRSMYAYLARVLAGVLGRTHKGWVNDNLQLTMDDGEPIPLADTSTEEPEVHSDRKQLNSLLSELMNRRLLAPEKAVLQLQLGHGLDPDQVRAALDMTPRQYKRRRAEGLEKLRLALDDYLSGKVCEEHAGLLALAATGELPAGSAEQLQIQAHLEHCGGCRAEVRQLKTAVLGRFAIAPWPVAIAAPGLLAAKASAATSWLVAGSKAGLVSKAAATAAGVAVLAGGTALVTPAEQPLRAGQARDAVETVRATETAPAAAQRPSARRGATGRQITPRNETAPPRTDRAGEARPAASSVPAAPARTTTTEPVQKLTGTLRQTTDRVKATVGDTVKASPAVPSTGVAPVDQVTGSVRDSAGTLLGS